MKKILLSFFIMSCVLGSSYTEGYKIYKQAKYELQKGNLKEANELFNKSLTIFESDNKSSQSILKTAELYCNGWGVEVNKKKAKKYLNKAKTLGISFISDKCLKNL